jgi:serine/threonine-protein kinase SRPK3
MQIADESILDDFAEAEETSPSYSISEGSRITYASRKLGKPKLFGLPVLSDFGEARFGTVENDDDIQPEVYRAPEVVLEMKWSYSVDIWNVGVMVRVPSL